MEHFHTKHIKIGITLGDINGVGPEVILKTFLDIRMCEFFTPIIYGSAKILNFYRKKFGFSEFQYVPIKSATESSQKRINVYNCWEEEYEVNPGTGNELSGKLALISLNKALDDYNKGLIDAIVTAPLDKSTIVIPEKKFSGHTSYIAEKTSHKTPLMILCGDKVKIALATGHVPVEEINTCLSKSLIIEKVTLLRQSLIYDFGITKPKIAVLGLNPHAGDNGIMGMQETDIIKPAVSELRKKEWVVFGPYPPDGFFGSHQYKEFDAVLAMYHDQGLIPFKLLHFDDGVNYTAGLDLIRTSPDHGTAFSIAGKGIANEESFRNAVFLAAEVYNTRHSELKLRDRPLPFTPIKKEVFKLLH